jgi:hypothetical protein
VGIWGSSPCTAVPPTCTDKEAGSNGVGFSMDTRLLGSKGMNGLKILRSTRLLGQTNLPTTHQPRCRRLQGSDTTWAARTTPTTAHPQLRAGATATLQGVPPSCCGRRVAVWSGACRTGRQGRESGMTCKQPANLAVEGAEESLTILSDYTPTVRPPPKRS